jgi:hypothetical protein
MKVEITSDMIEKPCGSFFDQGHRAVAFSAQSFCEAEFAVVV